MNDQANLPAFAPEGRQIIDDRDDKMGPTTFAEVLQFAERAARTSIVPKAYQGRPDDIVVCIMQGHEVGLKPLQSLKGIAVVNGIPSLYGDAPLALVYKSGKIERFEERNNFDETDKSDDWEVSCTVQRRGMTPITQKYSVADAKKAGLWGKAGPWQQYPKRMLKFRARGFALRDAFPDVLNGIDIYEEVIDRPVMRDVTPEEGVIEGPATASAKVRSKIADKKAPAVTLADVKDRIAAAQTEEELKKVGTDCGKLQGEEKDEARKAYSDRLAALKAPAEQPKAGNSLSDLIQNTDKGIRRELTNGAPYKATLDFYSTELAQILAGAPDEHAAMMAEYEQIAAERDGADA